MPKVKTEIAETGQEVAPVQPDRIKAGFSKEQILASARYRNRRDLVAALLDDRKEYTIEEVEEVINGFMKGKVK